MAMSSLVMAFLVSDQKVFFSPKITSVELGISSLDDAITCRIASRDAL